MTVLVRARLGAPLALTSSSSIGTADVRCHRSHRSVA